MRSTLALAAQTGWIRCAIVGAGLLALIAAASACISSRPEASDGCVVQGDCEPGLVCVDSTCRAPCNGESDCAANEDCVDGLCAPGGQPNPETRPSPPTSGLVPAAGRLRGGRFTLDAQLGEALTPTRSRGGRFRLEASATLNPGASR